MPHRKLLTFLCVDLNTGTVYKIPASRVITSNAYLVVHKKQGAWKIMKALLSIPWIYKDGLYLPSNLTVYVSRCEEGINLQFGAVFRGHPKISDGIYLLKPRFLRNPTLDQLWNIGMGQTPLNKNGVSTFNFSDDIRRICDA